MRCYTLSLLWKRCKKQEFKKVRLLPQVRFEFVFTLWYIYIYIYTHTLHLFNESLKRNVFSRKQVLEGTD